MKVTDKVLAEMCEACYGDAPVSYEDVRAVERVVDPGESLACDVYRVDDATAVVAFRGTCNAQNAVADADTRLSATPYGGRAHTGFLRSWTALRDGVEEAVGDSSTLYLTGHSLGGALATLATLHFASLQADQEPEAPVVGAEPARAPRRTCRCVTFGAPRVLGPVSSRKFDRAMERGGHTHTRFEAAADLVPRLPTRWRYRHVGKRVAVLPLSARSLLAAVRSCLGDPRSAAETAAETLRRGHCMTAYLRAVEALS